jgi:hypothetical protein
VAACFGVDQLPGDANALTSTPDASFENVFYAQF